MTDQATKTPPRGGLKRFGRAAVLAMVLGSTSIAALPAQAASATHNSSANFSFSFSSNGVGFTFGNAHRPRYAERYQHRRQARLSVKQIRRLLHREGFRQIRARKVFRNSVVLVAKKRWRTYIVRISRKDGHLISLRQVRKQRIHSRQDWRSPVWWR